MIMPLIIYHVVDVKSKDNVHFHALNVLRGSDYKPYFYSPIGTLWIMWSIFRWPLSLSQNIFQVTILGWVAQPTFFKLIYTRNNAGEMTPPFGSRAIPCYSAVNKVWSWFFYCPKMTMHLIMYHGFHLVLVLQLYLISILFQMHA